jgi:hypothetical protein
MNSMKKVEVCGSFAPSSATRLVGLRMTAVSAPEREPATAWMSSTCTSRK